ENARGSRTPSIVFFDGLDTTKEMLYFRGVPSLVERGMSCLIVDGPGTGEAIRFRGHYLRHDYEVAARAACDYLEKRPEVDPERLAVLAISLGGYYAPRSAAFEKRFKACAAWGAIWDYQATWKRRIEIGFKTSLSVPGHHIMWIFNAKSLEEALEKLEPFKLDGVAQRITCPFLLTHGAEDQQIPLPDAQALFDAVGSKDKTFKVFTVEEGGAQHCQGDNRTLGVTYIADWLEEKLLG
ncbi:MAG: alpha/beta hydrolase family protein, partial [Nitrospinota bacterium]